MVKNDYTDPNIMIAADQLAKDIKGKAKQSTEGTGK